MNTNDNARLLALFDEAAELPAAARAAFLDEHCGSNPALRARIERLLASDGVLAGHTVRPMAATGLLDALSDPAQASGARIGPYELREEIGSGGMGRVFRAERVDGAVAQKVAIKLIRRELLDAQTLRRFRVERQVLATLDHPNIARLLDAGELGDGAPYYVMELIAGVPITDYCDRERLDLRARLALLRSVCGAVLHAHRALVVHRDLKPGNILVTANGTPKLLDFGIAKPLDALGSSELTGTEHRYFSPQYSAPEQLLGEPIGVGCDVYALGLLLYEVLVGVRPFDLDGLTAGQVEALITRTPPESPSSRALRVTEARAALRDFESPAQLSRALRGDLDGIVQKCLRKSPAERYASVEQLESEIENALEGRPVAARGGHAWYRVRKFAGRHRLPVALATVAATALIVAVIGMSVQAVRLQRQRDSALAAQKRAEFQQDRAESVSGFLVGLFTSGNPNTSMQHDISARELLETGARRVDSELANEPALRAALLETIARSLIGMSAFDEALVALDKARVVRSRSPGAKPRDSAENDVLRARIQKLQGDYPQALASTDRALAVLRGAETPSLRAEALTLRASVLYNLDRREEVIAQYRLAHDVLSKALGPDHLQTLNARRVLGQGHAALGQTEEAAVLLEQTLARVEAMLPPGHAARADTQIALAGVEQSRENYPRAKALLESALAAQRSIFGDRSVRVASTLNTHAIVEELQGNYSAAAAGYQEAAAIQRELAGADAPLVAMIDFNAGQLFHLFLEDPDRARQPLENSVRIARKLWPLEHPNRSRFEVALAAVRADLGDNAVEPELRALMDANLEKNPRLAARARGELARVMLRRGDAASAAVTIDGAVEILREAYGEEDPEVRRISGFRAQIQAARSG